ncbi:MAG: DNA polymerase III subunit gamma/tau [Clostridia bacterium]|nr:DNA polymerase III subunit gamma/tau [Clostridia bacterium]
MAFVSLYRRFRPDTFDKVIGQNHIVRTLCNQIKNDRIGHSYLFTGTRGTGKTSCAKIFARAVNCLNPRNGSPCNECAVCTELVKTGNIDIIEIDAASNNGVDEIRQIKENTQYRPSSGRFKVYIIDEVHMLTTSAFNALLKTLEEPPEHIIFILATTEAQKLPATILSRCLRFDFRLVATEEIKALIARIFDETGAKYEDAAVERIAIQGEGSVRDAISVADMCLSYCDGDITLAGVLEALGASDFDTLHKLGRAVLDGKSGDALTVLDTMYKEGRNTIHKDLCNYFRDLIAVKNIRGYKLSTVTADEAVLLAETAKNYENYRISRAMETITGIENTLRYSTQPRILLEATIVKACEMRLDTSPEASYTRLQELERKLDNLEKRGVRAAATTETVVETTKESKADISKILEQTAVNVEEQAIFEEVSSEDEERAANAWDGVIRQLQQRGERTLYTAATMQEDELAIEGNMLILRSKNTSTVMLFNQAPFLRIMNECVKQQLGSEYSFACEKKLERSKDISEGLGELQQLFGGALIIKK